MAETGATPEQLAETFHHLFRAVYLRFHRRDERHSELSAASRALLTHLALSGPLTVGELALHLDRAQSVASDMVTHLQTKDLLERRPDPLDRRRTLIWLSDSGHEMHQRDQDVLSVELLREAFSSIPPGEATALNSALRALLDADDRSGHRLAGPTHPPTGRQPSSHRTSANPKPSADPTPHESRSNP